MERSLKHRSNFSRPELYMKRHKSVIGSAILDGLEKLHITFLPTPMAPRLQHSLATSNLNLVKTILTTLESATSRLFPHTGSWLLDNHTGLNGAFPKRLCPVLLRLKKIKSQ